MNDLQRFLAVCKGETPDYIPIFGLMGAQGVAGGAMYEVYESLIATGMPDIGYKSGLGSNEDDVAKWQRFWGTDTAITAPFFPADGHGPGIKSETTIRDGFEYIAYETGALIRQFADNDLKYMMPEYLRFHVTDRESFERYKALTSPSKPWPRERIEEEAKKYQNRTRPLYLWVMGTWGHVRTELLGPELACTLLYDNPELCQDIFDWIGWFNRTFLLPMIEAVKPGIVLISEDMCYKNGMLISPEHFNKYCAPIYAEAGESVKKAGVPVFALDCDGFVEPLLPLVVPHGINALYPWEMKAGNDLYRVRRKYPELIIFGGLEKECLNQGNEAMIRPEIESKLDLLRGGRYFPNIDHGMQPLIHYDNMRKFMTLLHEVTGNPKGDFPRKGR